MGLFYTDEEDEGSTQPKSFGFGGGLDAEAHPVKKRSRRTRRIIKDVRKDLRLGAVPPPPKDPVKRLGWANKHYESLPTKMLQVVADAALPDQDTTSTLNYLEREYDIPFNFTGWSRKGTNLVDPRGKMVNGEQALRILRINQDTELKRTLGASADEAVFRTQVQDAIAADPTRSVKEIKAEAERDGGAGYKQIAFILEGMRTGLPTEQLEALSLDEMVGYAVDAANQLRTKKQRKAYVHTLKILRVEKMPELTRHIYALAAGKAGWEFENAAAVFNDKTHINLGILVPNQPLDNMSPDEFRERYGLTDSYWAMRKAEDGSMWFYFPADSKWHNVEETPGNATQLVSSYYANTGTQPPVFKGDPNKDWGAPTAVNLHTINGDSRVNVQVAGFLPSNYSQEQAEEQAGNLYRYSIQVAERSRLDEDSFKRSPMGKVFGAVGKVFEESYKFGGAGIISFAAGLNWLAPGKGRDDAAIRGQIAAYQVSTGEKNVTQALKEAGVDGKMAAGLDFAVGIVSDPTTWVGAGVNTVRSGLMGIEGKMLVGSSKSIAGLGKRGVASRIIGDFTPLDILKNPEKAIMRPFKTAANVRTYAYFQTQGRLLSIPKYGLKWVDPKTGMVKWGVRSSDDVAGMTRHMMMDQLTSQPIKALGNKTHMQAWLDRLIDASPLNRDAALDERGVVVTAATTKDKIGRDFYAWATDTYRPLYGKDPVTAQVASSLQRIVNAGIAAGKTEDELLDLVTQGTLASYGIKALDPMVLDNIIYREATPKLPSKNPTPANRERVLLDVGDYNMKWAREQLAQAASIFHFNSDEFIGVGLMNEVPRISTLRRELAPGSRISTAMDAAFATRIPAAIRKQLQKMRNIVPDSQIPGEGGGFERWATQITTRAGMDAKEIEALAVKAREASLPFTPHRTMAMKEVADDVHRAMFDHIVAKYPASPEIRERIWKQIQDDYDGMLDNNARAFGEKWVKNEETGKMEWQPIDDAPILESQEVNYLPSIDPLWMKHYVRDQLDAIDGVKTFFDRNQYKARLAVPKKMRLGEEYFDSPARTDFHIGKELTKQEADKWDDLAGIYYNVGEADTIDEFYRKALAGELGDFKTAADRVSRTEELVKYLPDERWAEVPDNTIQGWIYAMDKYNSSWKSMQVVRPGYVPRIITDESIRSLSDIGIMSRFWASGTMRNIDRWTGGKLGFYFDPLDIPTADGKFTTLNRKRPLQQTVEPYVNTGKPDWNDIYGSMFQKQWDIRKGRPVQSEYGLVYPAKAAAKGSVTAKVAEIQQARAHMAAWVRSLDDARNSVPGQRILIGIRDGLDRDDITRRLRQWLHSDREGQMWVNTRNMDPDAVGEYAQTVTENIYRWANGDAGIAQAVLDDVPELRKLLKDVEVKPVVHGENMIDGGTKFPWFGRDLLDNYKRAILQTPTNKLSRQPFFRAWYQRMYDGQWDMIRASGVVPTDALEVARLDNYIKAGARRFAIERTNRVMFSMSQQGRWAEMIRFAVPFAQPWAEAFTVYSHLLRKNPAMVAWAHASFKAAEENELIKRNEETGDMEINMRVVRHAAPALMVMTGQWRMAASLIGGNAYVDSKTHFAGKDQFELYAPVSGFNMFLSGAIPADAVGLGGIFGNMSIPVPGLNPAMMGALQHFYKETPGDGMSEWLYQYGAVVKGEAIGTVVGLGPRWLQNALAVTGDNINPSQRASYIHRFIEVGQMMGMKWPNSAAAQEWAEQQVDMLYGYKAWLSLTSPAAPHIQWPTHELEQEWHTILESPEFKDDYSGALAEWMSRHPDMTMLPQSMSFWDEESGSGLPTLSLTPTLAQDMLSSDPVMAEMYERYPELAVLMMPAYARDPENYDRDVLAKQIAQAKRGMYSGEEALDRSYESAYWAEASSIFEGFTSKVEAEDLTYTDPKYIELKRLRDVAIGKLQDRYKIYDQAFDPTEEVDPRVLLLTRRVAADPQMQQFPIGEAITKFWAYRKLTIPKLYALGVKQIENDEAAAVKAEYDTFISDLTAKTPEFGVFYDRFFRGRDLMNLTTDHERAIRDHPNKDFLFEATDRLKAARDAIGEGVSDDERKVGYYNRAVEVDAIYREAHQLGLTAEQNPVVMDFLGRPLADQRIKIVSTVSKTYAFLDRFEREYILGEETSDAAEQKWLKIAEARNTISEQAATIEGFSSGAAYAQLNAQIVEWTQNDPIFAAQVQHANTWGYGFFKQAGTIMTQGGRGQAAWEAVRDAAIEYQRVVEASGIHGTGSDVARYNALRAEFLDDIEELREWSPTFDAQWEYYENEVGAKTDLTDAFYPPIWYRLGV